MKKMNGHQQKIEYDKAIQAVNDLGNAFINLDTLHRKKLFQESFGIAMSKHYINTPEDVTNIIKILKQAEISMKKRHI